MRLGQGMLARQAEPTGGGWRKGLGPVTGFKHISQCSAHPELGGHPALAGGGGEVALVLGGGEDRLVLAPE